MSAEGDGYQKLVEVVEEDIPSGARIGFLTPPAVVTLNSIGQHALEWKEPLNHNGVTIEPGALNLYTFPGGFSGNKLQLIRKIILELARTHIHLFDKPDPVGAFIIHALVVCNTEPSLEISFELLDLAPHLLLQTHAGQPFMDESLLHIVSANRREDHAIKVCTHGPEPLTLHRAHLAPFTPRLHAPLLSPAGGAPQYAQLPSQSTSLASRRRRALSPHQPPLRLTSLPGLHCPYR